MGKGWDHGVPGVEFFVEMLRVLKPGGHLLSFGGSRTYHRMACAVEDAGFEIRDQIMWIYGQGFPKSKNLDGDWQGWGTALKPAHEPIVMARKPLIGTVAKNVAEFGCGAINVDGCRVDPTGEGRLREGEASQDRSYVANGSTNFAATPGPRGGSPAGRWPANVIHDGSEEVLASFPQTASGKPCGIKTGGQGNAFGKFNGGIPVTGFGDSGSAARFFYCSKASRSDRNDGCESLVAKPLHWSSGDANPGSFQSEGTNKTSPNNHPTVKPHDLMRYLCRLVTPPGGTILDPFMGSGSTGKAAVVEGFSFIGIEQDAAYFEIAEKRIAGKEVAV